MNKIAILSASVIATASILQVDQLSVSAKNATMYVKVSGIDLNVRKSASTASKKVGTLKTNTKVTVISTKNGWSKIKFKTSTAYVSTAYLTKTKPKTTTTAKTEKATIYYVNTNSKSGLNVRKSKSTSAKKIGSLKNGAKAEVVTYDKNWSKIKYGSGYGYVSTPYLNKKKKIVVSEAEEILSGNYYATPSLFVNLNVRESASTAAEKLGEIKQNTLLQVISQNDGWTKIKFGSKTGFVSSDYVSESITVDFARNQNKTYTVNDVDANGEVKAFFQKEEKNIVKWGNVNKGFTHTESISANSYALFNYETGHGYAINNPIYVGATEGTLKEGYSKITSINYTAKVEAGTFKHVVVQKFYNAKGKNTKVMYFAPNQGVIKATENGKTTFELIGIK